MIGAFDWNYSSQPFEFNELTMGCLEKFVVLALIFVSLLLIGVLLLAISSKIFDIDINWTVSSFKTISMDENGE